MSTITMSALAPGARRPRSSRRSARAPPSVAALNTSAAVATVKSCSTTLHSERRPAHLADEIARIGVGAQPHVDAGRAVAVEATRARCRAGRRPAGSGPTDGAATRQDLEIAAAGQRGQAVGAWSMMQWPTMASGAEQARVGQRTPRASCRGARSISWNSSRFWPAWIAMPTPSSSAAVRVARSRVGLHVPTWKGKSIPWMRSPVRTSVPCG